MKACELLIFGGILKLHNVIKCFSQINRNKFVIRMVFNQFTVYADKETIPTL